MHIYICSLICEIDFLFMKLFRGHQIRMIMYFKFVRSFVTNRSWITSTTDQFLHSYSPSYIPSHCPTICTVTCVSSFASLCIFDPFFLLIIIFALKVFGKIISFLEELHQFWKMSGGVLCTSQVEENMGHKLAGNRTHF